MSVLPSKYISNRRWWKKRIDCFVGINAAYNTMFQYLKRCVNLPKSDCSMCLDLSLQPKVQSLWNRLLTPSSSSQLCVDRNRWTVKLLKIPNFAGMCNKIVVISSTTTRWQKRNFSLVEGLVKLEIALYGGQVFFFGRQELVWSVPQACWWP